MTIAVNLKSIFLTSKYTIAQMLKQEKSESGDRGWIINISSIFGEVGGYTIRKNTTSKLTSLLTIQLHILLRRAACRI